MSGLCYIHVNKYRGEKMQPVSEYTWRYISSKFFGMYYHADVCAKAFTPHIYNRSSYALNKSSNWSNPPLGPPIDPLKYGTPQKNKGMGDEEWNPI